MNVCDNTLNLFLDACGKTNGKLLHLILTSSVPPSWSSYNATALDYQYTIPPPPLLACQKEVGQL
jgi:hypothetical protein